MFYVGMHRYTSCCSSKPWVSAMFPRFRQREQKAAQCNHARYVKCNRAQPPPLFELYTLVPYRYVGIRTFIFNHYGSWGEHWAERGVGTPWAAAQAGALEALLSRRDLFARYIVHRSNLRGYTDNIQGFVCRCDSGRASKATMNVAWVWVQAPPTGDEPFIHPWLWGSDHSQGRPCAPDLSGKEEVL